MTIAILKATKVGPAATVRALTRDRWHRPAARPALLLAAASAHPTKRNHTLSRAGGPRWARRSQGHSINLDGAKASALSPVLREHGLPFDLARFRLFLDRSLAPLHQALRLVDEVEDHAEERGQYRDQERG